MPARGWVIFKNWMKDCVLYAHLDENRTNNGELKFPRYISLCDCGDMDCNNRRSSNHNMFTGGPSNLNSSINHHYNSEHGSWDEEDHNHAVYVKEDDVILQKGGKIPRYMSQDETKHAIKMLRRNLHSW